MHCAKGNARLHARLHARASLQLQQGQIYKQTKNFPFSQILITHPPTHMRQAVRDNVYMQIFLHCFSQPLLTLTFFNLPTHTQSTQHYQNARHIHPAGEYTDTEVRIHLVRGTGALGGWKRRELQYLNWKCKVLTHKTHTTHTERNRR